MQGLLRGSRVDRSATYRALRHRESWTVHMALRFNLGRGNIARLVNCGVRLLTTQNTTHNALMTTCLHQNLMPVSFTSSSYIVILAFADMLVVIWERGASYLFSSSSSSLSPSSSVMNCPPFQFPKTVYLLVIGLDFMPRVL